jgi:deazaflavin-dependent oxidoreductase (nitroreductase family)
MRSGGTVRYVDPRDSRGPVYCWFARFSASRFGFWLSRNISWKIDPYLLRLTRGQIGTGLMIPTGLLETRGARSGQLRRNGVIYFHDGEKVTIVASKAGAPEHPAWFYNARANPDVHFGGQPFRAEVVESDSERTRLWELADQVFPPFADYRERADRHGRTIPILQLIPR